MKGDGGESGGPPEEALTYAIINAVIAVRPVCRLRFL
jgi:hypothetical protein